MHWIHRMRMVSGRQQVAHFMPHGTSDQARLPRTLRRATLVVACCWLATSVAVASEPPGKIQLLVITGGHGFDREAFFEMLEADNRFNVVEARHESACEAYEHPRLHQSDVVLLYDMVQDATAEQKCRFLTLFDRGIGVVVLHHALVSHQQWPAYEQKIGGKYPEDPAHAGVSTEEVGYRHDVEFPVAVVGEHPVTSGLTDFVVRDEIYWGFRTAADVTPLLTTSHPDSGKPLAWARQSGRSRVVAIQPGHGPEIFAHREYRRLVHQSLCWAARKDSRLTVAEVHRLERPRVLRLADEALEAKPTSITYFRAEHSEGGPHDFYSNGDYWWPDPDSPDGLPYIQRDGESNPNNFVAHRHALNTTRDHVAALAAAYRLTGDDRYVAHARRLLEVFFLDEATRMAPHLDYAQAIPGRTPGRGIGIIDALHLIEIPKAVEAMRSSPELPDEVVADLKAWFAEFSRWMQESDNGQDEARTTNNHRVAYYLQLAVYARFVDDEAALEKCRHEFERVFLGQQMAPDGSFPRELGRTKPYGYSIFQLDNMATLCHVLSSGDEDLLSSGDEDLWRLKLDDGRGMRQAMEFLYPYLADKSKWPHRPDVQAWNDWPARQPALLLAGLAYDEPRYLECWKRLPPDPEHPEVRRNIAITQPLLWLDAPAEVNEAADAATNSHSSSSLKHHPNEAS